ncbi:MAG: hypothetical protein ACJA0X_002947 [Cyclobacteriaceae bacterium]|jgi:hypothetical protein
MTQLTLIKYESLKQLWRSHVPIEKQGNERAKPNE